MSATFKAFAIDFFCTLGVPTEIRGDRLHVSLSGDLAAFFATDDLTVTFTPHDPEGELLAYGSRLFDQMLDYLSSRGRHTSVRLAEGDRPALEMRVVRGAAREEDPSPAPRSLYAVHFHLSGLSDERTERLATFCLDASGTPAPALAAWLESAVGVEEAPAAAVLPAEVVRAAEDMAMAEAELLAIALEEETLGRLRKAAVRLVSYFEEQMAEIPIRRKRGQSEDDAVEAALDERLALRKELARKLAEETARHQLRLQVRRISQAVVEVPGYRRRWRVENGRAVRSLEVWENRHTGEAEAPGCERCGAVPLARLAGASALCYGLCDEQHLVCEACLGHCAQCGTDHCLAELADCHHCGGGACARCRGHCASGHAVCEGHLASCTCCGQAFCESCLSACPDCAPGSRLAVAHGHPCRVCGQAVCLDHAAGCGLCGQAVCGGDRRACPGCGDTVCADHLGACAHCELPYCDRCRHADPSRPGRGACRACEAVGHAAPAPEAWRSVLEGVAGAGRYGHWLGIENDRYRYMLGRGVLGDMLVVASDDGVAAVKEIGFWSRLFGSWSG